MVEKHTLGKSSVEHRGIGNHQVKVLFSQVTHITSADLQALLATAENTNGVGKCRETNEGDMICQVEQTNAPDSFHQIKKKLLNRLVNKLARIEKLQKRANSPQGSSKRRESDRFRHDHHRKSRRRPQYEPIPVT